MLRHLQKERNYTHTCTKITKGFTYKFISNGTKDSDTPWILKLLRKLILNNNTAFLIDRNSLMILPFSLV